MAFEIAKPVSRTGPITGEASVSAVAHDGTSNVSVSVRGLSKQFTRRGGSIVSALHSVSIDVEPGRLAVLLGPSGCGKTTLLRCVAGLETPSRGEILLHGKTVFSSDRRIMVPPEKRNISMMFQTYAIWPHMTVFNNVAYPLEVRKVPKGEIRQRVDGILKKMRIDDLSQEYPGLLSGGQQQRVALSRCLVTDPKVVLFDEPLSNVDAKVRKRLRVELVSMQRDFGFSGLYVTHDQEEAMHVADTLIVMEGGQLAQVGSSQELYDNPRNRYVASFLGSMNELTGKVTREDVAGSDGLLVVDTAFGEVLARRATAEVGRRGSEVVLGVRPEAIDMETEAPRAGTHTARNAWHASVVTARFLGTHVEYVVDVGGQQMLVTGNGALIQEGTEVWLTSEASFVRAFEAAGGTEGLREDSVDQG